MQSSMDSAFIRTFDVEPAGRLRVAVKDLIDVAGVVSTNGSRAVAASAAPAARDAACLAGTRAEEAAGRAVIVGKTNQHELAFGVTGVNPWYGTPVNPLDPALVPGGSSSGSAVAVATGRADVAFGSDTGGSIRIPSACCATVGLKTARGRVSLAGVLPLAPSLDTVGPMAATVEGVITGMSLLEPGFSLAGHRPARRVGRVRLPAQPWVDAAIDAALGAVGDRGGVGVTEVELPTWDAATRAATTILSAEAWEVHEALWQEHRDELSPDVAERLELASMLSADSVAEAWEVARDWSAELSRALDSVDALALPVLADAPPRLADAARIGHIRYGSPCNLAGVPALALPVVPASLPVVPASPLAGPTSLQLVGPDEEGLLATGLLFQPGVGLLD